MRATLRATGWARIGQGIFLGAWLCGWAAGEAAAAAALVRGISRPEDPSAAPAFLLVWLTFWTFGGLAAGSAFLHLVAGRDDIEVDDGVLVSRARTGPFARMRRVSREEIRRVLVHRGSVVVETTGETFTLTTFGSSSEQEALVQELRKALAVDETVLAEEDAALLPPEWESATDADGAVLRRSASFRRKQVGCLGTIVVGLGAVALLASRGNAALAAILGAVEVLVVLGVAAYAHLRTELVLSTGRAIVRSRLLGRTWDRVFEPASVELEKTTDSDGDEHHRLVLRGGAGSRVFGTALNDARELEHLARWIVARVGGTILRR